VQNYKLNNIKRQAGMTLIELTVVLLILIGLAGLLIPYVGSFVQKTHDSTNSSNLSSLNGAVLQYLNQTNKLPNNLETLTNATTTGTGVCPTTVTAGDVYCAMLDTAMFTATTFTGTSPQLNSFIKAGLTAVHDDNPAATNKTFQAGVDPVTANADNFYNAVLANAIPFVKVAPVSSATATANGIATTVAAHLALALGGHETDYDTTCNDYVAMGIGDHTKMIGTSITAAPVHFPEDATKGPTDYYNHYLAIIQVQKSIAAPCSSNVQAAKFVGVVMNVPNYGPAFVKNAHLYGANASLGYAYDNNSNK
jgi:type II secretory pathway pseudopilin PulG